MAPKLPLRRKSSRSTEEEGRRKRAAPPPAPSSSTISTSKVPLPSRRVECGKNVDFSFLEKENFAIGRKIKQQGWEFYCSLKEVTYVDLVREFYLNLVYQNGTLRSMVKGMDIVIDPLVLADILHLPSEGYCNEELSSKEEGLRIIFDIENVEGMGNLETRNLSIEIKLLHQMVSKLFFPRGGRHDFLSGRDLCMMHHIVRELPLNLPVLMIEAMRETQNRSKAHLPYGMGLTLVFRRFGVCLDGEAISRLSHTDTIGASTLHRMGFSRGDHGWFRGVLDAARAEGEGPSSPHERGASPDNQIASDHDGDTLEAPGGTASEPASEHQHHPSTIRLEDDQLQYLSQQLAGIMLSARRSDSRESSFPASSSDQSVIPYITTQISSLILRIERLDHTVSTRLDRLEQTVSTLSQFGADTSQILDLSVEAGRLRGLIGTAIQRISQEISSSGEDIAAGIGALMQSMTRAESTIDAIAFRLSSEFTASYGRPYHAPSHGTLSRGTSSRRGRGRGSSRGCSSSRQPHHQDNPSDSD